MQKTINIILSIVSIVLVVMITYLFFGLEKIQNDLASLRGELVAYRNDNSLLRETKSLDSEAPNSQATIVANNNLLYKNDTYGFTLTLPERWNGYKVTESKENVGNFLRFELKLVSGKYQSPFLVAIFNKAEWAKINSGALNPYTLLAENNGLVFAYSTAQDDTGYDGFPEPKPGTDYYGPISDVTNIIIPSFTLR